MKIDNCIQYENHFLIESEYNCIQEINKIYKIKLNVNTSLSLGNSVFLIKNSHVVGISLPDLNLTEIPEILLQFPMLEKLSLAFNKISDVPEWISKLERLKEILLSNNTFQHFFYNRMPLTIEWIDLSKNQIDLILKLDYPLLNLKVLNLKENLLKTFPECLKDTPNLWTLYLDQNPINKIPDWSIYMPQLINLFVIGCDINEIPEYITNYPSLKEIYLGESFLRNSERKDNYYDYIDDIKKLNIVIYQKNEIEFITKKFTFQYYPLTIDEFIEVLKNQLILKKNFLLDLKNHNLDPLIIQSIDFNTLLEIIDIDIFLFNDEIEKNIRINFDFENRTFRNSNDFGFGSDLIGLHRLDNGLVFLGCAAGGDWQIPVFYILYWNGEQIQAYTPLKGNLINRLTSQAYKNDFESDFEDIKHRFKEMNLFWDEDKFRDEESLYDFINDLQDQSQMIEDITNNSVSLFNRNFDTDHFLQQDYNEFLKMRWIKDIQPFLTANNIEFTNFFIQKRFRCNENGDLISLNLSHLNMTEFINPSKPLLEVKELILNFNEFENVNIDSSKFPSLTRIELKHNRLKTIPENLNEFKNLTEVKADFNDINRLGDKFKTLTELTLFSISHNKLTAISFSDVCKSIIFLDISFNDIREIQLTKEIPKLISLNISNNPLGDFAFTINYLSNLSILNIQHVDLTDISFLFNDNSSLKIIVLSEDLLQKKKQDFRKLWEKKFFEKEPYIMDNSIPDLENQFLKILVALFQYKIEKKDNPLDFSFDFYGKCCYYSQNGHINELIFNNRKNSENSISSSYTEADINLKHEINIDILGIKYLSLDLRNFWNEFPSEIKHLNYIRKLAIYDDTIVQKLPIEIGELISLEFFQIISNNIDFIPSSFENLCNLKILILKCPIIELNFDIKLLKNLEELTLITDITDFPLGIDQLPKLKKIIIKSLNPNENRHFKPEKVNFNNLNSLELLFLPNLGLNYIQLSCKKVLSLNKADFHGNPMDDVDFKIFDVMKQRKFI